MMMRMRATLTTGGGLGGLQPLGLQRALGHATVTAGRGPEGLQPLGLQRALGYGRAMLAGPAAIAELYSPPRVTAHLPGDLAAGSTFDLTANVNGERWDFSKPSDRKRAFDKIRAEEPYLVIGSPPCTMFSSMQNMNKQKGKAEWQARRRAAEVLLVFAAAVYKLQVASGRHFLHEHPAGATSWNHPSMVQLLAMPGVGATVAHQCAFGLWASTPSGSHAPAKKPTRFMTSAPAVLEALSKRCPGGHAHAHMVGGTRARDAAVYPPGLCAAIARGASEQRRRDSQAGGVRAVRAWRDARGQQAARAGTAVHLALRHI